MINHLRPDVVAEVGAFIGRSTYSVTLGHALNDVKSRQIQTCDFFNDIRIDFDSILESVIQYPKKSSTDMLNSIIDQSISTDIYLLDGRFKTMVFHYL
jgi:hypothetical protein